MKLKTMTGALMFVLLWGGQAFAQLSKGDIAAMRTRADKEGWTFAVGENEATQYAIEELCGLIVPEDWRAAAPLVSFKQQPDLPAEFDWRPYCTPIKSQGACGSCWAFSTVGALECAISIRNGVTVDLSEQWLVSCNRETEPPHLLGDGEWGCVGGWFAHEYHQWKPDSCAGFGAVLEADLPYEADDVPCNCPYIHSYWIDSWAYIGGEEEVPSVDSVKQAIMTYGPVSAAVHADSAFQAYSGGVFNTSTPEEVNHAIILVGWNDSLGTDGAWILRNSWGSNWGLDGYMYIEYGCSNVGFAASYIDYRGARLGADSDGDGLRDEDEIRSPDPDAEGVQNPFDPYEADSTGDDGDPNPDGVPDGRNDWDADTMSNRDEFTFGYNPTDPDSWTELPLLRLVGCAVLVLVLLAAATAWYTRHEREIAM